MNDQNCTTDQYGNQGCIGTAVHTHSTVGGLPMTGIEGWVFAGWIVLGIAILCIGLAMAGRARP